MTVRTRAAGRTNVSGAGLDGARPEAGREASAIQARSAPSTQPLEDVEGAAFANVEAGSGVAEGAVTTGEAGERTDNPASTAMPPFYSAAWDEQRSRWAAQPNDLDRALWGAERDLKRIARHVIDGAMQNEVTAGLFCMACIAVPFVALMVLLLPLGLR